jgi:hypothetical protein
VTQQGIPLALDGVRVGLESCLKLAFGGRQRALGQRDQLVQVVFLQGAGLRHGPGTIAQGRG